jgi:hypothetical protein
VAKNSDLRAATVNRSNTVHPGGRTVDGQAPSKEAKPMASSRSIAAKLANVDTAVMRVPDNELRTLELGHLMLNLIASRIMRTTVDIADPILREVRAIHQREGRSMGAVVSELLADALAHRRAPRARGTLRWTTRAMHARVDLTDKDALYSLLDDDRS